jgi:hypothetical protein
MKAENGPIQGSDASGYIGELTSRVAPAPNQTASATNANCSTIYRTDLLDLPPSIRAGGRLNAIF